jgi:hypothetical protein
MKDRYYARSARDDTDDWPFWFVADAQKGGLNVTAELIRHYVNPDHIGGVFCSRNDAEFLEILANGGAA